MPRVYKKKVGTRMYQNYSKEKLEECLNSIRTGERTQREAEEYYNIPRRTINYKLKNQHLQKVGKPLALSDEEEDIIVDSIIAMCEFSFPIDLLDLKYIVKQYLDSSGRTVTVFKNNLPGREWAEGFFKRHSARLSNRYACNVRRVRAAIDEETVRNYIDNLSAVVKDVPPENIWNYDETNVTDNPGQKKVLARRGMKYPERICNTSKASISIMYCGSAAGELMPPYVVYKSAHLWDTWTENGPKGARYSNTSSGWFDVYTFTDWFKMLMLPKLKKLSGKKVLIGDNLSSHINQEVLRLCRENNIYFVCLPPNSTHLTQPLDVAFFHPLKQKWRKILFDYKSSASGMRNNVLQKQDFPHLLKQLHDGILINAAENLKSGFRKCGVFPCDVSPLLEKLQTKCDPQKIHNTFTTYLSDTRLQVVSNSNVKRGRKRVRPQAGLSLAHTLPPEESASASDEVVNQSTSKLSEQENKNRKKGKRLGKDRVNDGSSSDSDAEVTYMESDESDWNEEVVDDPDEAGDVVPRPKLREIKKKKGEYVVFQYEQELFPGVITDMTEKSVEIKAMQRSQKSWKWPERDDVLEYDWADVIGGILPPKKISKRGLFSIPELDNIWGV